MLPVPVRLNYGEVGSAPCESGTREDYVYTRVATGAAEFDAGKTASGGAKPEAGVISILPEHRSGMSECAEELLVRALHERTAMQISTREYDLSPFYPLHIICRGETRLVLGAMPLDADTRYKLLVVSAIQEIMPLSDTFKPPDDLCSDKQEHTGNRDKA